MAEHVEHFIKERTHYVITIEESKGNTLRAHWSCSACGRKGVMTERFFRIDEAIAGTKDDIEPHHFTVHEHPTKKTRSSSQS